MKETGAKVIALQLDTWKVSEFDLFVQSVHKALWELGDYLVNNAGTSHHAPFEKVTGRVG